MGVDIRDRGTDVSTGRGAAGRPVLLATLGVPLNEEASVFAVDTAVESGQRLVVANVTALEPLRMSIALGYDALPELTPEVSASLRRSAELARSLGVRVERLRVRSPRPRAGAVGAGRRRASGAVRVRPGPQGPSRAALPEGARGRSGPGHLPRLGSERRGRPTVTFLIDCPNCGPREALEFSYGGERTRRAGPDASDRDLAGYLFFRENVNGWQTEWWLHRDGCRKWFLAERHTGTNEVRRTFWPGEGDGRAVRRRRAVDEASTA